MSSTRGQPPGSGMARRDEAGLAATFVVAMTTVLVLCTWAVLLGGRVMVDHRRAASAADLAALAAATAVQSGQDACSAAVRVATGNGAQVFGCDVEGEVVTVTAVVRVPTPFGAVSVRASGRAGPR